MLIKIAMCKEALVSFLAPWYLMIILELGGEIIPIVQVQDLHTVQYLFRKRSHTQKNLCNEKLLRLDAVIIFKRGCCHFGFLSGQCIQCGFYTKGLEILSSNYQKFPTFHFPDST